MRIPLAVSLESRDGGVGKDAKVLNGIVESRGQDVPPTLYKRPGVADQGSIHTASAQLLYNWNGIKAILGDTIYSGTISTIVSSPTSSALSPTNAGLQFTAAATNDSAATPRLMFKNQSQAWTMNRSGTVSSVTYGGTMGSSTYTLISLTRVSTTATATYSTDAFSVGDSVTIAGAGQAAYNGTVTVTGTTTGSAAQNVPLTITRTFGSTTANATSSNGQPHGLTNGSSYAISGATESAYNGTFAVTVTGSTTFTYTVSTTAETPASPATGSPTVATWLDKSVTVAFLNSGSTTLECHTPSGNTFTNGESVTVPTAVGVVAGTYTVSNRTAALFDIAAANGTTTGSTNFGSGGITRTGAASISSITRASQSATATIAFSSAHNFQSGATTLTISGASQSGYNVTAAVTVTDSTHVTYSSTFVAEQPTSPATGSPLVAVPAVNPTFSYAVAGSPTTPATGTITAQGTGGTVPGIPYIDGYFCVMDSTGVIWNSNPDDPTTWGALNFLTARQENGAGKALGKSLNYLVAFKEYSTEYYYDAQNATGSPFSPVDNGFTRIGCASGYSVARVANSHCWVSQIKEGNRSVHRMDGLQQQEIATADICRIVNADTLATVYAFGIDLKGHPLYLLTLPGSNITLVYDLESGFWSQWSSLTLGSALDVASLTLSGTTATMVTALNHSVNDGDPIKVSGSTITAYNGIYQALKIDAKTLQFQLSGSPASPATPASTFTTWNPSDKGAAVTLTGGNLTATTTTTIGVVRSVQSVSSGKWYWETTIATLGSTVIGAALSGASLTGILGADASGWGYIHTGASFHNGVSVSTYGATYTTGDVIGVALDLDAGTLTFYKNGVSQGVAFSGLSGTFFAAVSNGGSVNSNTTNFGASTLASTPTGFNAGIFTTTIKATPYTESYFKFIKAMTYNGSVYFLHESDGHLYQMLPTLYQDAGIPINLFSRSVRMDGGDDDQKKMKKVRFIGDLASDVAAIRFSDDDSGTFSAYRLITLSQQPSELRKCGGFRRRSIEFRHVGNTPLRGEALELEIAK